MTALNKHWLKDPTAETVFIMLPAILPVIAVLIFKDYFTTSEVSTIWWVMLVLCIDVAHVYSTLFRLYWDKQTFQLHKALLITIPVFAFFIGFAIHLYNDLLFWRILAYVAVYHFVRQQYGFVRLYSRKEHQSNYARIIDSVAVYNATLYPILYWHINATDKISWFVKGDFVALPLGSLINMFTLFYAVIILIYVVKETIVSYRERDFNIPKNLIMAGTYLSWYVGIVAFQGDLIFTLLNVVAHGIPYIALIWIHGQTKTNTNFRFNWKGVMIFAGVLWALAYTEEYFWDGLLWKEHADIFPFISGLNISSDISISILVALLVLPQITHYVLDGFIWRFSKDRSARIETL